MSLRLEMLQVARLAPKLLGEAAGLVRGFLLRQQNADGGFKDRSGKSDLYYTVFALDGLLALQAELPRSSVASYLRGFDSVAGLDFVHLCCLARAWAALGSTGADAVRAAEPRAEMVAGIERFRAGDGGYHPVAGSPAGTAYGAFLALGAYQDLKAVLPEPLRLVQSLKLLETSNGAWANERSVTVGSTNATAAAVTVLRNLDAPINPVVGDWLLARCHPQGGFTAAPGAPIPDLLSTATALHALAGLQVSLDQVKECCLDFVDSLWTNEGAFHGHWGDEHPDCEYTFYGLLALGHLSV
jgi:prenyltransferase beta subunit